MQQENHLVKISFGLEAIKPRRGRNKKEKKQKEKKQKQKQEQKNAKEL